MTLSRRPLAGSRRLSPFITECRQPAITPNINIFYI